ncbi:MAG: hypothetical protein NTY09_14695 [bacterium]|nr:hypothetical protein [bacterium]
MSTAFKPRSHDKVSFKPELSASMIYRELERYHIETIYDPLASTSGASWYFKLQNMRVISNDLALFAYVKGKALWENNIFTIPAELTVRLTNPDVSLPELWHYKTLGGDWISDTERRWLEYWRQEINETKDEYERSLVETAICMVVDQWITVKRFKVKSSWSPSDLLGFYINHVNRNVLDNNESNEMWRTDPVELSDKVIADVLFINPPPLKGYSTFGVREHILESWLRGMSDFPLTKIAPKGRIGSSFGSMNTYMEALSDLLKAANHIPIWAFALSNRQPFTHLEFATLMKDHKRKTREIDLKIARHFFSLRAPDTVMIAVK